MKNPFSRQAKKQGQTAGLETVPPGAQVIPMEVKRQYEANPVHLFHPTPHNAITVLRSRRQAHEFLVCGWYLDTFRERGVVKGLVYRAVSTQEDKDHVVGELRKLDKEAAVKFAP